MQNPYVQAYKKVERHTLPPRENEARVLTEGALMLQRCQEEWADENRPSRLDEALKYNLKIWTFFRSELAREGHPMSGELRLNLLKLGRFIHRQIIRIMISPTPEHLNPIININRGLAKGLAAKPGKDFNDG